MVNGNRSACAVASARENVVVLHAPGWRTLCFVNDAMDGG